MCGNHGCEIAGCVVETAVSRYDIEMKLRCFLIGGVLFGLCVFPLMAQFLANPNDRIYEDLRLWEGKGLVRQLPVMRPYPAQLMKEVLERVVRRGNTEDSARAREYLEELRKSFTWHAEAGGEGHIEGNREYADAHIEVQAGGWLTEKAHLEGRFKGLIMDNTDGFVLPRGERTSVDIFDTWADMDAAGRKLNLRQSQNVSFSFGESDLYFQAGIMRNSFGPFWGDGVVLSADAPHSGHYSFVWRNKWISYSTALLELAATSYIRPSNAQEELSAQKFPDKHLAIQSLNFYPAEWLELAYFESMVWGNRMDLTYLLPFKELFYAQSMAAFEDNSFVGIMADFRVAKTVKIPFIVYMDDTNLNDLLSFKFGTKFKTATQAGVQWTPEDLGIFKRIAADYVIVTPYMYTHRSGLTGVPQPGAATPSGGTYSAADRLAVLEAPNYNNYTHMGTNLGVGLDPNSDRLGLQILVEPFRNLRVNLIGRMMRHANASLKMGSAADLGGSGGRNDGSIYDDGYDSAGDPIFHYKTYFLSQAVIERTYQGGFQAEYSFGLGPGSVLLAGGYLFEHIRNKDLVSGQNETNHYGNFGIGYRY
ncbi:MAG: hypothetical protein LBK13_05110 [Spirochaetales bacterium]|nr:hypothetical protein [Spirochaetales bacterium]